MDKEQEILSTEFLKEQNLIDYEDNEIVLIDDMKYMPTAMPPKDSVKLDMIYLMVCTNGRLQMSINGKQYDVRASDMVICPHGTYLDECMMSPDFESKILGISYPALERSVHINKEIWDLMMFVIQNPVIHLNNDELQLLTHYYAVVRQKIETRPNAFHKEIMHSLFQSAYYEVLVIIKNASMHPETEEIKAMNRSDYLFKRFLELLGEHAGKERSVTFYANEMCITPKYLSTVVKSTSGKSALEWIHQTTTDAIVRRLKYSDKTIKEIADELNFPNLSFFGKFVKAQLGMPPKEYRRQCGKAEG